MKIKENAVPILIVTLIVLVIVSMILNESLAERVKVTGINPVFSYEKAKTTGKGKYRHPERWNVFYNVDGKNHYIYRTEVNPKIKIPYERVILYRYTKWITGAVVIRNR